MLLKNEFGLYQVDIEGNTYQFTKWGAETSLSTLIKLTKIVGKPFSMAIAAFATHEGDILLKDIPTDVIERACEALLQSMDEDVTISIIKKLSSENVICNDKKVYFDSHYKEQLGHLFKVVKVALEVQFGDFLGDLLQKVGGGKKQPLLKNRKG
jgi:hypothetical protein